MRPRVYPAKSVRHHRPPHYVSVLLISSLLAVASTASEQNRRIEVRSQTSNLHQWASVTLFHGLPSDHVRAIAQDQDGTILLGTNAGLARYDGRRVQKIPSLLSRPVLDVEFDQSGTAWIATYSGAARLIRGEAEAVRETEGDSIRAIATAAGRVVLLGERSALYDCRVDAAGSLRTRTIDQRDSPLLEVGRDGNRKTIELTSAFMVDDRLLVGTHSRGLLSLPAGEELGEPQEVNSRPRPFFVETITREAEGRVWFGVQAGGGDSGLFHASDLSRPVRVPVATGTVTSLSFDQVGDLWVGTHDQGILRLRDGILKDHFTFENTAGGLRSDRIYTVFADREGVVWFGTDRGACRYDPGGLSTEMVSLDAESNVVRVLYAASNGQVWCGTNRGLFLRDPSESWNPVSTLRTKPVHSIAEDSAGRLLVGTASGLFASHRRTNKRVEASTGQFVRVTDDPGWNVRALCLFRGAVFAGSFGRGLDRLDGNRRTAIWPAEPGKPRSVLSLHADRDKLLIGTSDAGVFVYDGVHVSPAPGFTLPAGAVVWSIEGSLDDALWMATSLGLYVYRDGRLDPIVENCDARYVEKASSETSDMAWCATAGCGLFKVRLLKGTTNNLGDVRGATMISKIDTEQGLASQNTFAVAAGPSNRVWIGTSRGVASYRPGGGPPLLAITGATAARHYSAEEALAGLVLGHDQSFAIDLAASSSRSFPEQFHYVFTLGDSRGQQVTGPPSRIARMTMGVLQPGKYWMEARAYNVDLVESDPVRVELTIESAPFPWTSTSLGTLLAFALVALGWGWLQNRKMSAANRQLTATRLELANETERERRRIARDLHDQTLADLRRLMMLSDQMAQDGNGRSAASNGGMSLRDEIEAVSTEVRRICEDLSPSALANVGLAAALEWALADAVRHRSGGNGIESQFVCDEGLDEKLRLSPADQIQIYRIAQEAITNVCKHSSAARVRLTVAIEMDGSFMLELEDNGRGFNPTGKNAGVGRGLVNIRSRASLISAQVTWSTTEEGGGVFSLRKLAVPESQQPL